MLLGIDHIVIAVPDPDEAVTAVSEALGLPAGGGGRHDRLGTGNRLIWLGDSYLEFLGVFDRDVAEASWLGGPALARLDSAPGGGLVTWAIATDDIDGDVARLRAAGSDMGPPEAGERRRPDGAVVRWRFAIPRTLERDGPPFLIEHDSTAAEWTVADRAARSIQRARLVGLESGSGAVGRTTRRLLGALDLRFRPSLQGGGARDADVGPQFVRIRPLPRDSAPPVTIRISMPDRPTFQVDILGCRWVVGP